MTEIKIEVKNKIAKNTNPEIEVVCDNSGYVAVFDFDEEWQAETLKTAIFSYNGYSAELPFEGNKCYFPVLIDTQLCRVGVTAGDIKTTTSANVRCRKSIKSEGGEMPPAIHKDLYDQIIELYDKFGSFLNISVDKDYVLTVDLLNKDGKTLSQKSVDLPIENLFISARYDSVSKAIIFILQNGQTLSVPIGDLIEGIVSETDFNNLKNTVETNSTNIVNLDRVKQEKTDDKLNTESKEIVGAINEVKEDTFVIRRWL